MEIIWRGHLNREKGFGNTNYNVAKQLSKLGYKIVIDPIPGQPTKEMPKFCHMATKADMGKGLILITSQNEDKIRENYGGYQILYTAMEGTTPCQTFFKSKEKVNEIWVPSYHSFQAASKFFPKEKIFVMPSGIDLQTFDYKLIKDAEKRNKFTFLSICRWTWRKAPDLLIDAFKETFKEDEADLIILSTVSKFPEIPKLTKNIRILKQGIDIKKLIKLYSSCHAFVLPTRGEGWGLPFTEAGALGLPIIATNWGGQTDYLNKENAYLLKIDGLISPPSQSGNDTENVIDGLMPFQNEKGEMVENLFSKPSKKDLKKKMRFVYENYSEALKKAEKLRSDLANITWQNSANIISSRLSQIFERYITKTSHAPNFPRKYNISDRNVYN